MSFGYFQNDLLQGQGRMILYSGDIYDGFFSKGKFNGPGIYYNIADNKWTYGIFSDNKIVIL